jgi:hypothetical protein
MASGQNDQFGCPEIEFGHIGGQQHAITGSRKVRGVDEPVFGTRQREPGAKIGVLLLGKQVQSRLRLPSPFGDAACPAVGHSEGVRGNVQDQRRVHRAEEVVVRRSAEMACRSEQSRNTQTFLAGVRQRRQERRPTCGPREFRIGDDQRRACGFAIGRSGGGVDGGPVRYDHRARGNERHSILIGQAGGGKQPEISVRREYDLFGRAQSAHNRVQ